MIYVNVNNTLYPAEIHGQVHDREWDNRESKAITLSGKGLSTRIFLLSGRELGFSNTLYLGNEGSRLDYFSTIASRIGYYNGTATMWWTRSPSIEGQWGAHVAYTDGSDKWTYATTSQGIRPAFILPSDIQVDSNFNIIA